MFSSPIFIVGAGRSGTTLMRSLLAAHSRLVVTPETQFLVKAADFGGLEQRDARRCEAFWQTYIADPRFVDLEVDPYRCRELAAAATSYEGIAALLVGTLEAYRERHGKPRVGEKTPDHVWFVQSLLATFPDARVLVMQRDPRAVVASHMRMWWTNYHPPSLKNGLVRHTRLQRMVARALEWMKIYGTLLPQFRDNERVCIIKYEELVDDPQFTLHRICEFVDEPFEPEMVTNRSASTVPDFVVLEKLDPSMRQWA